MENNVNQPEQRLTKRQRRELKHQEQTDNRAKQAQRKQMTKWIVIGAVVIIAGGLVYWGMMGRNSNNQNNTASVNKPFLGSTEAKVVLDVYSDFSCPACAAAEPVIRQLAKDYSDRSKIVFNPFNIGHSASQKSLEAGLCAQAQNKFWEFGDLIFSKQADWVQADDAVNKLKSYAREAGLDGTAFDSCLDSGSMAQAVKDSTKAGQRLGVDSTPSFFINNKQVTIVSSFDELKTAIEAELNKTK